MGMMGDLLYSVDPNTMVLMLTFIIIFLLINFPLKRVFKKERASSTIISLCVALLAVYGINRMDFDLTKIFYGIGISKEVLYTVLPWVILGLIILASFAKDAATGKRKFRLYRFFMILGVILIALGLAGLVYQRAFFVIAGVVLFLLGLFLWWRIKKKLTPPGAPGGSSSSSATSSNERDPLINAAKKFKSWAKSQSNPKFVGSWANFVNYLKRGGWGNSESEICQRLNISQNEFVKIFNRYGLV